MKKVLLDLQYKDMVAELMEFGFKKYQAEAVYIWLNSGATFEEMTNIKISDRERLATSYIDQPVKIKKEFISKDGTHKFLYELNDKELVEGVLMKYKYGYTLCVSTQIGCRMNCIFCASHLDGLKRNLSSGEILGQVVCVNKHLNGSVSDRKITNIVLMGMGEPLDNYENVIDFLMNVNYVKGLNIAMRNISISTCGVVPRINQLKELNLQINLTISLHNAFQEKREKIMPVAKAYNLVELISACKNYFNATKRRVIFEYTLIKGVNDSKEDAEQLAKLLKGFPTHINLIRLNPVKETGLKGTSIEDAKQFLDRLVGLGMSATIRRQMAVDIEGACGQLRRKHNANG